jgi:hypothetical protein
MWYITSEDFKNYAAGIQSIVTIAALIAGGIWTWRRFFQFREGKPKIDLKVEVTFVRKQMRKWIVTVDALLENKAKVRHEFKDFTFDIRYTIPSDELENVIAKDKAGKNIALSVKFPHSAAKGSWLEDAEGPETRMDYGALEPGESDSWTFIACLPENATMILACCELYDEQSKESLEATKVVAVPEDEAASSMPRAHCYRWLVSIARSICRIATRG